jgi:hypothetical protein
MTFRQGNMGFLGEKIDCKQSDVKEQHNNNNNNDWQQLDDTNR